MSVKILHGDCREVLRSLPPESIHAVVTSPPYYGLRSYIADGDPLKRLEIGIEDTMVAYIDNLVAVFCEVHRVLRADGVVWLNLGDSYSNDGKWGGATGGKHCEYLHGGETRVGREKRVTGLKPKDLCGVPWRVAFALQAEGWWLRSAIVWAKPNGMPGSQEDRVTSSYEMIFMLAKSPIYWSDFDAIKTPPRESSLVRLAQDVQSQAGSHRANGGAKTNGTMKAVSGRVDKQRGHSRVHAGFNDRWDQMERSQQQSQPAMMRDVWFIPPGGYDEAHFAVMPDEVARRCILAGSPVKGVILDPFGGAGTVGLVADRLNRNAILIELNPEYIAMAERRICGDAGLFAQVEAVST